MRKSPQVYIAIQKRPIATIKDNLVQSTFHVYGDNLSKKVQDSHIIYELYSSKVLRGTEDEVIPLMEKHKNKVFEALNAYEKLHPYFDKEVEYMREKVNTILKLYQQSILNKNSKE